MIQFNLLCFLELFTLHYLLQLGILLCSVSNAKAAEAKILDDWSEIEWLAEQYPYIIPLLDDSEEYICTGTIIDKRTVLTSGYCNDPEPTYVAPGLAIFTHTNTYSNKLKVAYTRRHIDYNYRMSPTEPNLTQIHSNIALVFVVRPVLTLFVPASAIGSVFASELQAVELTTIGFGAKRDQKNTVILQYQKFAQIPCINPRWYYCICGTEVSRTPPTYDLDFGNGAPVIYGGEVIGVTSSSTGILVVPATKEKYNIFTVIAPYIPWIEKTRGKEEEKSDMVLRTRNEAPHNFDNAKLYYTVIVFLIIR